METDNNDNVDSKTLDIKEINEGRDYKTESTYFQEKRFENADAFNDTDEARDKKAEIVENRINRDFPINPEKQVDNTKDLHFLDTNEFRDKHLKDRVQGNSDDVAGYYNRDTDQVFIKETDDTLTTAVHEKLHQKSMNELPQSMDEGITEHLAREEAGGIDDLRKIDEQGREIPKEQYYEKEVDVVRKLDTIAGRESINAAYFEGKTEALQNNVDTALGEGSFREISKALERKDYDKASEIIDRYYKR